MTSIKALIPDFQEYLQHERKLSDATVRCYTNDLRSLNLDFDSTYGCKIEIETIPDGDFFKIVAVNKWSDTV